MIAVIDYGAGNLRSIKRALEAAGAEVEITDDPDRLSGAEAIVLPGVGNAGHAVRTLDAMGMSSSIRRQVEEGKPFLGICVGMQVLFEHQEEGGEQGLGLLPGRVRQIQGEVKVPHMGWSQSRLTRVPNSDPTYYYFVHSFIAEPDEQQDVVAEVDYGERFPSIVHRDNVWGTQFHPEKSGQAGLEFIQSWVDQVRGDKSTG